MILNNFRKEIIKTINNSGLSIDCIYFVLKDVLNEVVQSYNNVELEEQLKEQEKENKEQEGQNG